MRPPRRRRSIVWLLGAMTVFSAGCATLGIPKPPQVEEVSKTREVRKAAVVRSFEQGRDFAEYQAAWSQWKQGDLRGSQERLETLLARNPNHRDARLLLVKAYRGRQEAVREAASETLGELDEDGGDSAVVPTALDAPGEAEVSCRRLAPPPGSVSASPDNPSDPRDPSNPQRWIDEGAEALASGSDEAALDCFDRAVALQPDDPRVRVLATVACLSVNRPEVAVVLAKTGLGSFPDSAPLERALGTAYYRLGDYTSSQVALQQALSLDKSSAVTYFLMGCTLEKLGRGEAAAARFRQAREIDPSFASGRLGSATR